MDKLELLLPAGNLGKLKIGLQYGGDAFYLGFSPFSMRAKSNGFSREDLLEGVDLIRGAGKEFYMTMNIFPRSSKFEAFKKHLQFVRENVKPDGIIVADPGLFDLIGELYPEVERHISVQANVINAQSVKFWQRQGAQRVILPRELMLKDIQDIHKEVPDIELEVFVHGAICMAYSGRCLLSNYMTERDSNQGACSHSCRWKYNVHDDKTMEDRKFYLEEQKRPGQFMPIEEDENGTYIMNSKDNCCLAYLKDLADAGVCSFKVEGRNKSEYYLSTVAKAYRQAIDDIYDGKPFDEKLMIEIEKTANRGFIPGFLFGFPDNNGVADVKFDSASSTATHEFAGMIVKVLDDGLYEVDVRNRFFVGEEVEVMTPDDLFSMNVEELFDLNGQPLESVHGGAGVRVFKLEGGLPVGSMLRTKLEGQESPESHQHQSQGCQCAG